MGTEEARRSTGYFPAGDMKWRYGLLLIPSMWISQPKAFTDIFFTLGDLDIPAQIPEEFSCNMNNTKVHALVDDYFPVGNFR